MEDEEDEENLDDNISMAEHGEDEMIEEEDDLEEGGEKDEKDEEEAKIEEIQQQIAKQEKELEESKAKIQFLTTGKNKANQDEEKMGSTNDLADLMKMTEVVDSLKQRDDEIQQMQPPKHNDEQDDQGVVPVPDHKFAAISQAARKRYILPTTPYSAICNSDFAPLVCNEFCQQVGVGDRGLERREAIELVRHFCAWLQKENLTCAVVEPIN